MIFHDSKGRPCVQYVTRLSCGIFCFGKLLDLGGFSSPWEAQKVVVRCHWWMPCLCGCLKLAKGRTIISMAFLTHLITFCTIWWYQYLWSIYIYIDTYMRYSVIYSYRYTYVCESTKGMSCHVMSLFQLISPRDSSTLFWVILPVATCCLEDKIYNEPQHFRCVQRLVCAE